MSPERYLSRKIPTTRAATAHPARLALKFGAGLLPLMILLAPAADAHEAASGWKYPLSCCSGYDCRPVSAKWIQEEGGAFIIPTTGEAVPYTDKRIKSSPDGEYHWCSKYGKDDTPTICLFVPPRSF
jgi:hypothetical protein